MTATFVDGPALQRRLVEQALSRAAAYGIVPEVALVMVENEDPLVEVNFSLHQRVLTRCGFTVRPVRLQPDTSADTLHGLLRHLGRDDDVDAVMVLMPLPAHLDVRDALAALPPEKEVEGLHPRTAARLLAISDPPAAEPALVPQAALAVIAEAGVDVGRSHVVICTESALMRDNPVANLVVRVASLAALPFRTPVTLVDVGTPSARELCRQADVLIVSLQRHAVVTGDWVRPGALVIDFNPVVVGTRDEGGRTLPVIAGGVDTDSVARVAGSVSAIPGGMGPVMLGQLVRNVVVAAVARRGARALLEVAR